MREEQYNRWLAVARRYSRRRDEAMDLLQEALVFAIRAGREDPRVAANQRWMSGTLRKLAAMHARSATRRKRRESAVTPARNSEVASIPASFMGQLSPALRKIATLIAAGLNREEIQSILGLSATAFRQRLTGIRKAWDKSGLSTERVLPSAPTLDLGPIRRALLAVLKERSGVGAYDPDGHLIIFARSSSQKRS